MLRSAVEQYREQQRITAAGVSRARRARRGPLDLLTRTVIAYQVLSARSAAAAVPAMLDEQNLTAPAVMRPRPEALAGSATDGRSLMSLLAYARTQDVADHAFDMIVATQLQDVARQSEAVAIAARPAVTGYVRMVNPPSCSRCAVLAGRFYRWNDGFQRHPRCDCRHVPTTEANAGDIVTEPRDYFDSLPTADEVSQRYPNLTSKQRKEAGIYSQEDIFTKAGAEAIRLGADPAQVVNARRGMTTAQPTVKVIGQREAHLDIAGQRITTYEPITETVTPSRRRLIRDEGGLYTTETGALRRASRQRMGLAEGERRLMPESILELSNGDREHALSLLQRYGYLS